jgi:uncharacterized membrane protein
MYITVIVIAAVIGHDYPKAQADMKRVLRSWVLVLGTLLALGSFEGCWPDSRCRRWAWPAAVGLVLYFVGALVAHLRVGSRQLIGWAMFSRSRWPPLAVNL